MTPISSPVRKISGTTPDVDKVMRRLRQRQAVAVGGDQQCRLDVLEIVERLAHAHHHHIGDLAAFVGNDRALPACRGRGNRRAGRARAASCDRISSAVRLRTSFCVPVWQNEQVSVQPTWLETQSVPRPSSGM